MAPDTMQTTAARARMHATRHGLDEDTRKSIVIMLNQRLADAIDLRLATKHAHWNAKGMEFIALHKLFDELAEEGARHVDTIGERITALGGTAMGTVKQVAQTTSLPEIPADVVTTRAFVDALAERYAHHARRVGEGIDRCDENGDKASADVLTGIARKLDKALYLLEAHLQGK